MSIAREDLAAMRVLLAEPHPLVRMVAFCAQQACEKSLKAVLHLYGADNVPWTHDMGALVAMASRLGLEPPFARILADLTTYAAESRYTDPIRPGAADLADAVRAADAVVAWAGPLVAEKLAGTEYEER